MRTMTVWAGVILAAGKSTRMKSRVPKVLHRVCGQEMLGLVVDAAQRAGLERLAVVRAPGAEEVGEAIGPSVEYVIQEDPLGTGHALLQAQPALADVENLLVICGDTPLIQPHTLTQMMALHTEGKATLTLLTSTFSLPDGLGRVVRDAAGRVVRIIEEREADEDDLAGPEINSGIYCFDTKWLWRHLEKLSPSPSGEIYLTDLVALAAQDEANIESVASHNEWEILGVNNRVQLAQAETIMRQRIREHWMLEGVTLIDPGSTYIDTRVEIGQDTVIYPNTHIRDRSRIGKECHLGPNTIISDSVIGDECRINASMIEGSLLEDKVEVGPFSHIRPESHIEREVHIGNFAEVKKSRLGRGTKMGHFSYIGDATLGSNVNVGAGTVTCNYDGVRHNETIIGDDVFIGSDSMLVAPVQIGTGAATGAGSVVTKDVPPHSLAVGAPARIRPQRKHVK